MSGGVVTGLVLIGCGVLFIALGLPLARGRVSRNAFYGYRTRTTRRDDRIWYPVNAMTGIWLIWAGVLAAVIGLLLLVLHNNIDAQRLVLGIGVPALIICLVLGIYRGWSLARAIDAEIDRQERLERKKQPENPD